MKKRPKLDRDRAMSARPERLPAVRCEEAADGGVSVTVRLTVRSWLRWLGGGPEREITRTFTLDSFGREVYDMCNGKADVKTIIRRFADEHKLSAAEAEMSVTAFLKTLMAKGLVAVAVDRQKEQD